MDNATLQFLAGINQIDVRTGNIIQTQTTTIGSSWIVVNSWSAGSVPTLTGRVANNTTTGAMPIPTTTPFLGSAGFRLAKYRCIMQSGSLSATVLDRLVDFGGASAIPTTAQNFTAQVITRYTNGIGNKLYIEIYANGASANATNITISYTNENSVAGRSAIIAVPASWCVAGRVYVVPLQTGDKGVISVENVTCSVASPNAGNFGVTIAQPLGMISSGNVNSTAGCGAAPFNDITRICWKPVLSNACMFMIIMSSLTVTGVCDISYSLI